MPRRNLSIKPLGFQASSSDRFDPVERYEALHGLKPKEMLEQPLPSPPKYLVDLGPVYKICYFKRIMENGVVKTPRYCHDFGEHWPGDERENAYKLAPILARDEKGRAHLIPQRAVDASGKERDATFVTDHGYEDLPMSQIRSIAGTFRERSGAKARSNPTSAALPAAKSAPAPAPVSAQESTRFFGYTDYSRPGFTQVRVRQIGPRGLMARHVGAGFLGAAAAPLFDWLVMGSTRLSSFEKALLILGVGALSGVGLSAKYPRLGAGAILGAVAVSGRYLLDAASVSAARATETVGALPGAAPITAPTPSAPSPSPAPPAQGATAPTPPSGGPVFVQPLVLR